MSEIIYAACAITSILCSVLLLRGWRQSGTRLLFWSGLCFAGLAGTNVLLVLDQLAWPEVDLLQTRLWISLAALLLMLYGLIFSDD
jgi:hypothetical protein